jgi:hypothetical protein
LKHLIAFLFALVVAAGENPKATLHTWTDTFGLSQGVILYPQYAWSVKTSTVAVNGFGFVESAPHERLFTNNLVWFTPTQAKWFSVHTETGGFPAHNLGFYQIGARVNTTEMIPRLKKPLARLFVAALPRFIGIRPNNILVAGATNPVKIKRAEIWTEAYYRFFPSGHPYGEWWFLIKPKPTSRFSYGALVHHTGKNNYVGVGFRASFF